MGHFKRQATLSYHAAAMDFYYSVLRLELFAFQRGIRYMKIKAIHT